MLWTHADFKKNFGRDFNAGKDFVGVMNADAAASDHYFSNVSFYSASGTLWIQSLKQRGSNAVRINYIVVLKDN